MNLCVIHIQVELRLKNEEIIVTKTDFNGRITYANDTFLHISSLTEKEAIGAPHNIIRHQHMPSCIFKTLWDTIRDGRELFAYVLNRATTGDHYWVFAHVTPTFNADGTVTGYHSNRRVPDRATIKDIVSPLYEDLLRIEKNERIKNAAIEMSMAALNDFLAKKGLSYERFLFSLQN